MLGHRLRRWPNIETALDECLVLAESLSGFAGRFCAELIGYKSIATTDFLAGKAQLYCPTKANSSNCSLEK